MARQAPYGPIGMVSQDMSGNKKGVARTTVYETTQGVLPSSPQWTRVVYGNGVWLTVAEGSSSAATSSDGVTWTARTLPVSSLWSGLAFGNGLFALFSLSASSNCYTSPDGVNWTIRSLPVTQSWLWTTFANGQFLATAFSGQNAVTSPDGINWTSRVLPTPGASYKGSAYGNGVWVVLRAGPSNSVAVSTDNCVNWTTSTMPVSSDWISVDYGNGIFVAVSSTSGTTAAISTNGTTWTAAVLPTSSATKVIAYGNGGFIVTHGGINPIVASTSPDGINWTIRSLAPITASYSWVSFGNNKFVSVSANTNVSVLINYVQGT